MYDRNIGYMDAHAYDTSPVHTWEPASNDTGTPSWPGMTNRCIRSTWNGRSHGQDSNNKKQITPAQARQRSPHPHKRYRGREAPTQFHNVTRTSYQNSRCTHMIGDVLVLALVHHVLNDEHQVETRQQRVREVDVLLR